MSVGMRRAFTAIAAAAAAGLMATAVSTGSVATHHGLADHIAHDPGGVPYSNGVILAVHEPVSGGGATSVILADHQPVSGGGATSVINTNDGIQGSGIVTDSNGVINTD